MRPVATPSRSMVCARTVARSRLAPLPPSKSCSAFIFRNYGLGVTSVFPLLSCGEFGNVRAFSFLSVGSVCAPLLAADDQKSVTKFRRNQNASILCSLWRADGGQRDCVSGVWEGG